MPGNGGGRDIRFHAVWLRDNAPDSGTRSPQNGQRLISITDIPDDLAIRSAELAGGKVMVRFSDRDRDIAFEREWLAAHPNVTPSGWSSRDPGRLSDVAECEALSARIDFAAAARAAAEACRRRRRPPTARSVPHSALCSALSADFESLCSTP